MEESRAISHVHSSGDPIACYFLDRWDSQYDDAVVTQVWIDGQLHKICYAKIPSGIDGSLQTSSQHFIIHAIEGQGAGLPSLVVFSYDDVAAAHACIVQHVALLATRVEAAYRNEVDTARVKMERQVKKSKKDLDEFLLGWPSLSDLSDGKEYPPPKRDCH